MLREPSPRTGHAAVGIGSKLYVWGGFGQSVNTKTLEIFDVPSMTWEQQLPFEVTCGSNMPDTLYNMATTSAESDDAVYSFGGQDRNHAFCNTVFQITPAQKQYEELQPTSSSDTAPENTSSSCTVRFGDKLLLYGGRFGFQERSNELHVFDLKSSECEQSNFDGMHDNRYSNCKLVICMPHLSHTRVGGEVQGT